MSDSSEPKQGGALPSVPLQPIVRFSESFKGLPLRKVEFLCGQGGSVVKVVVQDKHGNLATVDEWGKVLWHMSDAQALAYEPNTGGEGREQSDRTSPPHCSVSESKGG